MRRESLPSPGKLSMGVKLQSEMAKAVSAVELSAAVGAGGKSSLAKQLDVFLTAAKTAIAGFIDTVLPTVSSRNVGAYADPYVVPGSIVRIRTDKALDPAYVPAAAAFALASPAKTISKVAIDGPDILLYVTVPYVSTDTTATVAYTKPGTDQVRDLSGNELATFAAAAIANTIA